MAAPGSPQGRVPSPETWRQGFDCAAQIPQFIKRDSELSAFWLPVWESKAKTSIEVACAGARREVEDDLHKLSEIDSLDGENKYRIALERLSCLSAETRGSGVKTALLAAWLVWIYRDEPPIQVLTRVANTLFTDTTIGTMAGALLGALAKGPPHLELMDKDYLACQSARLARLSAGRQVANFQYPDLLSWKPPRTQLDAVGTLNNKIAMTGLGDAEIVGPKFSAQKKDGTHWQWLCLGFGQTVLSKQRENLPKLQADSRPVDKIRSNQTILERPKVKTSEQTALFDNKREARNNSETKGSPNIISLDELTREAIRSCFNPEPVGKHLLDFSEISDRIEKALAYSAIIVKARRARLLSARSEKGNAKDTVGPGEDHK